MKIPNLGIDIAKAKFNVCLLQLNGKLKHKVFPNTEAGFEQLSSWLLTQGTEHVHACLEATGNYGEALSLSLHGRGHTVSVINPAAIKTFAAGRLSRTKTDRVDAGLIVRSFTPPSLHAVRKQRAAPSALCATIPIVFIF